MSWAMRVNFEMPLYHGSRTILPALGELEEA